MSGSLKLNSPSVVGTIHSPAALTQALSLKSGQVDYLELRVDHFVDDLDSVRRALPKLKTPLILTVRHSAEGGAGQLRMADRRLLYGEFMEVAALMDVELRSSRALSSILKAARDRGVGIILSHHRFDRTPSLNALKGRLAEARGWGADVFKVATQTESPADVAKLRELLESRRRDDPVVSAMGMGPEGRNSRLILAQAGSVLNYGYLGEAQVSGQWPALALKERLAGLGN